MSDVAKWLSTEAEYREANVPGALKETMIARLREAADEINRLRDDLKDRIDFLAASSLCEACQKKREERAIIATPRIQVEEERDRLRAELADAERRHITTLSLFMK